jgi:hypothetical protein
MLKLTTAAALVAASLSASAMTAIADQDLSAVAGQDGVSIAADLNINIGAFTYGDTDGAGTHTVSFKNITVTGLMSMTIDVIGAAEFAGDIGTALATYGSANTGNATLGALAASLGYNNTADVVQFAFPAAAGAAAADAHLSTPTIKVGSIATGNGGSSFGSITITNLDLQGTKVWMFGHN